MGKTRSGYPVDDLVREVRGAIRRYDATGDHARHTAGETDCIRCALVAVLPKTFKRTVGGPVCGHSHCRQNWIDTGDVRCQGDAP